MSPDRLLDDQQIEQVVALARRAGAAILAVYNAPGGFEFEKKIDDSFLTLADTHSNAILMPGLAEIGSWPVLSEENLGDHDPGIRRQWQTLWMIDPLDGTKDFVQRTGEFAINIALIHDGEPHWGLVFAPVLDTVWFGGLAYGSRVRTAGEAERVLQVPQQSPRPLRTLISRNHHGGREQHVLAAIDQSEFGPALSAKHGSSVKYCKIAEGAVDFMPRLHPCMEWDTAAPQAILEGAGGQVLTEHGERLRYNLRDSLTNGNLVAIGPGDLPWQQWLSADA